MKWIEHLLSPITVDDFLEHHFGKQSLVVPGTPAKAAHIYDAAAFAATLARLTDVPPHTIRASHGGRVAPVRCDEAEQIVRRRGTVCVAELNLYDDRLCAIAADLKTDLNWVALTGVHAYWSGDGAGFDMHYDARSSMTLQLAGEKRWRFGERPAVHSPRRGANVAEDGVRHDGAAPVRPWEDVAPPIEASLREAVLRPGDVLFLPAGTWHEAKAIGGSLAINVWLQDFSFVDFVDDALRDAVADDEVLRSSLTPRYGDDASAAARTELASKLTRLASALTSLVNLAPGERR